MPRKDEPRHFLVSGNGAFPIDMLRHDRCHPATEAESGRIVTTLRASGGEGFGPIALRTYSENAPTTGRWESFGWRVVTTS